MESGYAEALMKCEHAESSIKLEALFDVKSLLANCLECKTTAENYVCLTCGRVFCGRWSHLYTKHYILCSRKSGQNAHMLEHNAETGHLIAAGFEDLSFWCYGCNSYLNHLSIKPVYDSYCVLHKDKFGDDVAQPFLGLEDIEETKTMQYVVSGEIVPSTDSKNLSARVGLVYDDKMCAHFEEGHPECPDRIKSIFGRLKAEGIVERCVRVPARPATDAEVLSVHDKKWLNITKELGKFGVNDEKYLMERAKAYNSVYMNSSTIECALLSAGSTVELVKQVASGKLDSGLAIVRPPGHHAEAHCAMGFCLFNNVALAAKAALQDCGLKRVAVVDWDVHHGNGTQKMFYDSKEVLFFSVHRFDQGMFYPGMPDAGPQFVGKGAGEGYNINVGWNDGMMGDEHYKLAFQYVLLPILEEFQPELIIVSAGFDAARGDPLGGCALTPNGYSSMLSSLKRFANGKVVVVLEGGYNLTSISTSFAACAHELLGDTIAGDELLQPEQNHSQNSDAETHRPSRFIVKKDVSPSPTSSSESSSSFPIKCSKHIEIRYLSCVRSILQTLKFHSKYWPSLLPFFVLSQTIASKNDEIDQLKKQLAALKTPKKSPKTGPSIKSISLDSEDSVRSSFSQLEL